MQKTCKRCNKAKSLGEFYAHPGMADGYLNTCKDCKRAGQAAHRAANLQKVRAYDVERAKSSGRRAHSRRIVKRMREQHPEKYRAQTAVGNAIRDGRLLRGPCEVCGTTKRVHGHHDDYSKPLEVRWLCPVHHKQRHIEMAIAP